MKNLKGLRCGSLTAIRPIKKSKSGSFVWECLCDCGNTVHVISGAFNPKNKTKSCKTCANIRISKTLQTHGLSKHKLYGVWWNMCKRCSNPKDKAYNTYGGRGIKVYSKWKNDFKSFFDWAISNGWQANLQIDRRNNDKGYFPKNCRFIPQCENVKNKSLYKNNKTNYRGVYITQYGYKAAQSVNGKQTYLGSFKDRVTAALARDSFVKANKLTVPLNFEEKK